MGWGRQTLVLPNNKIHCDFITFISDFSKLKFLTLQTNIVNVRLYPPPPVIGFLTCKLKNTSGYKCPPPPDISPSVACIQLNSTFYSLRSKHFRTSSSKARVFFTTFWYLKLASKFIQYLDRQCYVACFETFFGPVISPAGKSLSVYMALA